MITSTNNAQVKQVMLLNRKSRERKKQDVFLVEGLKMFREVPRARLVKTYLSESFYNENLELLRQKHPDSIHIEGIDYEVVKDSVFSQMSDTLTPQGILTIVRQFHYTLDELECKEKVPTYLVLEDLQDPGNVGTIFRTAEGAGVNGIIMTKNCVDIYNPKTIRSTMGSIYRVPFVIAEDMEEILAWFRRHEVSTYAAHLKGEHFYDEEDYCKGTAFFIGNEGNGLSDDLAGKADYFIKIPMEGQLESLNAGVACAILMYEASRQRRTHSKKKM